MTITLERMGGFLIARAPGGALDVGSSGDLKRSLIAAAGESRTTLILDISSVREIDSAGLGALVAVQKALRKFGGEVRLCGVQPEVRSVIETTMLHRVLPLHESVADAMRTDPHGQG